MRGGPRRSATTTRTNSDKLGDRRDVFWYCLDRGSISSGGGGGGGAPCDAAGQCSAIPSGFRRRAVRLSGFAARGGARGRLVSSGLLRDVESRAFGGDSASSRGLSLGAEVHAREIRILLERGPCPERARVARAVLFLPVGRGALVAGPPLRGVEPGARRTGGGGRGVEVVQCRGSLRVSGTRRLPGHGAVAPSLVRGNLAEVLGGGRSRIRTTSVAALHSYGASAGRSGVHPETRTGDPAVLDSTAGRASPKRQGGQKAGGVRLRPIARHRARCQPL